MRSKASGQTNANKELVRQEKYLRDIELKLSGLYDAIADGLRGRRDCKASLIPLENEKSELLKTLESPTSATVSLHPALADIYKQKINQLADVLKIPKYVFKQRC